MPHGTISAAGASIFRVVEPFIFYLRTEENACPNQRPLKIDLFQEK
jgi:hypothetical protein